MSDETDDLHDANAISDERETNLRRRVGFLKGKYTIPDDIKAFGREEIEKMFGLNEDK